VHFRRLAYYAAKLESFPKCASKAANLGKERRLLQSHLGRFLNGRRAKGLDNIIADAKLENVHRFVNFGETSDDYHRNVSPPHQDPVRKLNTADPGKVDIRDDEINILILKQL
jgi:hypothetical protein